MSTNTLGFNGHRKLPAHLIKAANDNGININKIGHNAYKFEPENPALNFGALCPSYIEQRDGVFDVNNAKAFLEWIHQPTASFLNKHVDGTLPPAKGAKGYIKRSGYYAGRGIGLIGKHHDKVVLQERKTLHSFLNFALTGSTELEGATREALEKETAECHAGTEEAMREADEWRTEGEIGNTEDLSCVLPHTQIDLEHGFTFTLDDKFLDKHNGNHQREMAALFWQSLSHATGDEVQAGAKTFTLTGGELEAFMEHAEKHDLNALVEGAAFEQRVEAALGQINTRARKLTIEQATQAQSDHKSELQNLLHATTALTPIVEAQELRDLWWRNHFTESWYADKKDTPFAEIGKEYAVFAAVTQAYLSQDKITPAQMEAIIDEFHPLLMSSDKVAAMIEGEAHKEEQDVPQAISSFRETFASIAPRDHGLSDQFLDEDYQEALETIADGTEKGVKAFAKALTIKPIKGGAESFWDFTTDVWNYFREDPKQAVFVIGLGTALYMMSGTTEGLDAETLAQANDMLIFGENGLEQIATPDNISAEAKVKQSFHIDLKATPITEHIKSFLSGNIASPYYAYKHFTNYAMIEGTEWCLNALDAVGQTASNILGTQGNEETAFSIGSKSTMYRLAAFYFALNLFQNFSHTGFWGWAAKKGFSKGMQGAHRIAELSSSLTDPLYQASVRIAEVAHLKKKTDLSKALLSIAEQAQPTPLATYDGDVDISTPSSLCPQTGKACALTALAKAAQARASIETSLPSHIRNADIELKIGGIKKVGALKRAFTIGAHNLKPTLEALEQFDHVLEHMAEQVGIDEPWYQAFLKEKIDGVTEALQNHQKYGDEKVLRAALGQALQDIAGAEIRHFEKSPLWEALFSEEIDAKAEGRLHSRANRNFGVLKRQNATQDIRNSQEEETLTAHLNTKAKTGGIALWGGVVSAARTAQKINHVIPVKPAVISALGVATTCTAMDMLGVGNPVTDAVSYGAGIGVSSTIMSGIFAGYNWFIDDVIFVHLGTGAGLMAGGVAARVAYKTARPFVATTAEKLQPITKPTLGKAWNSFSTISGAGKTLTLKSLRAANSNLGKAFKAKNDKIQGDAIVVSIPLSVERKPPQCSECPMP